MTIAAGFSYRNGVLLCADTELTGWAMTLHERKVRHFSCPGGKIGITYAGNAAFAISTIQKCERRLQQTPAENTLVELERIIDKEYRKTVLSHPSQSIDQTLHYSLVIGISSSGEAKLYATEQTALRRVDGYVCVGIGDALAHYLIRPTFSEGMQEREVVSLAAFMLSGVKDYVPGCGGMSQFVGIRDDGIVGEFYSKVNIGIGPRNPTEWLEKHAKEYELISRLLFFTIANPDIDDATFDARVKGFMTGVQGLRRRWRESNLNHESVPEAQ